MKPESSAQRTRRETKKDRTRERNKYRNLRKATTLRKYESMNYKNLQREREREKQKDMHGKKRR